MIRTHSPFGITRYELLKLGLMIATLATVLIFSVVATFRVNVIISEQARQAEIIAKDAKERTELNREILRYTQGSQRGLEDRVTAVENRKEPATKVVVVVPTVAIEPTPIPRSIFGTGFRAVPTPTHPKRPGVRK